MTMTGLKRRTPRVSMPSNHCSRNFFDNLPGSRLLFPYALSPITPGRPSAAFKCRFTDDGRLRPIRKLGRSHIDIQAAKPEVIFEYPIANKESLIDRGKRKNSGSYSCAAPKLRRFSWRR
jgi:hypothetical protein